MTECKMVGGPLDGVVEEVLGAPPEAVIFPVLGGIGECECLECQIKRDHRYVLDNIRQGIAYYKMES